MRVLVSVFAPIYWTTVLQRGAARNGYSFTHGHFRQESQLEFDTGESGCRRTVEQISRYTSFGVQYVDLVHMQQQVHSFKNKLINLNYVYIHNCESSSINAVHYKTFGFVIDIQRH